MRKLISSCLYILIWLLFVCQFNTTEARTIDSSKFNERVFNSKSIDNYKSMEEFQYREITPDTDDNSIWNSIGRFFAKLFEMNSSSGATVFWKFFTYVLIGGFIIFLILKIIGADKSWFLHFKRKSTILNPDEETESIAGIDFSSIIAKAIENKEYRKAIRYFYLFSLQILSDKNLIEWKPEKTNNDYLNELKSPSLKSSFRDNTLIYEYIYYGDFKINESSFNQAKISFEKFISSIKKVK